MLFLFYITTISLYFCPLSSTTNIFCHISMLHTILIIIFRLLPLLSLSHCLSSFPSHSLSFLSADIKNFLYACLIGKGILRLCDGALSASNPNSTKANAAAAAMQLMLLLLLLLLLLPLLYFTRK